ncbi:MAG: hypothetical protein ACKVT0_10315 [Planctomycetaceae bacterium]
MGKEHSQISQCFRGEHNSLFSPGPNGWLNACVGKNGGYAGFDRLAHGYFKAGEVLVDHLRKDRHGLDLLIYPLVQCYRQGIENMLKYLSLLLTRLQDSNDKLQYTHRLLDNWQTVRKHLTDLDVKKDELEKVELILSELAEIDATGETFRYPRSRDGKRHLEDTTHINVDVFADGMSALTTFFEGVYCWATEMLDQKLENEQYYSGDVPNDRP